MDGTGGISDLDRGLSRKGLRGFGFANNELGVMGFEDWQHTSCISKTLSYSIKSLVDSQSIV